MASLRDLPERHRHIAQQAIANVLATPLAETTFGQIVDGVPLSGAVINTYNGISCPDHPLLDDHLELAADVLELTRQLRDSLDLDTLRFSTVDYDQYPDGIADGVAFWAENHILGGVILFDRRSADDGGDLSSIYVHSDGNDITYRIYRLLDEQKQQLLQFLLADTSHGDGDGQKSPACPLPIQGDKNNRIRVDPEDPPAETGIYRDLWERKPLSGEFRDPRFKDVLNEFDYTSYDEWLESRRRAFALERRRINEQRREMGVDPL